MKWVKATFFVPHRDNDGTSLQSRISDLETELYVTFVGRTMLGVVKGAYRMADQTMALDVSNSYMVVLDQNRLPELESILRDFKARTTQEAIFLELQYNTDIRFI